MESQQSQGQTKKCPKCNEEIQSSAKVCKHCQSDLRSPFAKHKILTGFLVLVVIAIFNIVIDSYNETRDTMSDGKEVVADLNKKYEENKAIIDNSSNKPAEPAQVAPKIIVTSVVISKDYADNEVSADAKYKDKLIEISGKIANVSNGTFDNEMVVKLSDGQYNINGAMCYMKTSERDKVLVFKKGQQVTLIGTGSSATLGSPVLKDCVIK
ncbi:MAG: hypothetical protein UV19_C0017G0005 [Parcubacteria group bacterium GW2011_GWA2_42_28]|nr:MAG: hypothetical protein UV19_C0017G0005 [Parcubacteria group bacterium GW2011_GWA2_42_28]